MTPGARERFQDELQDLSRLYRNIEMSMTDVSGIYRMPGVAAVRQGIGQLLLSDWGRRELREAVIEGRGRLSANALATLFNAARREMAPSMTKGTARGEQEESRRAPGGQPAARINWQARRQGTDPPARHPPRHSRTSGHSGGKGATRYQRGFRHRQPSPSRAGWCHRRQRDQVHE